MTHLKQLAARGNRMAIVVMDAFNPDQERDEKGMWTSGGAAKAASSSARTPEEHTAAMKLHRKAQNEAPEYSRERQMHYLAALAHEQAAQSGKTESIHAGQAAKMSSSLPEFLGGKPVQAQGTAAQVSRLNASGAMKESTRGKTSEARGHMAAGMEHEKAGRHAEAAEAYKKASNIFSKSRGKKDEAAAAQAAHEENKARAGGAAPFNGGVASEKFPNAGTPMPSGWTPGVGNRPAGDLRSTQKEMPAVREASTAQLAMSQRVPAGSQKPQMGSDPNRSTQELPAVSEKRLDFEQNISRREISPAREAAFKKIEEEDRAAKASRGIPAVPSEVAAKPLKGSVRVYAPRTDTPTPESEALYQRALVEGTARRVAWEKENLGRLQAERQARAERWKVTPEDHARWDQHASLIREARQHDSDAQKATAEGRHDDAKISLRYAARRRELASELTGSKTGLVAEKHPPKSEGVYTTVAETGRSSSDARASQKALEHTRAVARGMENHAMHVNNDPSLPAVIRAGKPGALARTDRSYTMGPDGQRVFTQKGRTDLGRMPPLREGNRPSLGNASSERLPPLRGAKRR